MRPRRVIRFSRVGTKMADSYGGTKQALAEAADVPPEILSRDTVPPLEICIRLADLSGKSAAWVLKATGFGDTHTLIEKHYGKAARQRGSNALTPLEKRFVHVYRSLDPKAQEAAAMIIEGLVARQAAVLAKRRRSG